MDSRQSVSLPRQCSCRRSSEVRLHACLQRRYSIYATELDELYLQGFRAIKQLLIHVCSLTSGWQAIFTSQVRHATPTMAAHTTSRRQRFYPSTDSSRLSADEKLLAIKNCAAEGPEGHSTRLVASMCNEGLVSCRTCFLIQVDATR